MDLIPARFVFVSGFCCTIAGCLAATGAGTESIAFSSAILMGFGFGWTFVAMHTAVGNFYGQAAFPKLMGTLFLLSAICCSPAGFVGGKLFDVYGSYTPSFLLIVGICLLAMAGVFFARMPVRNCGSSVKCNRHDGI
jgi:hypothetical protein